MDRAHTMNAPIKDDSDQVGEALLEASYCTKPEDFFSLAAREMLSRYLPSFLEQLVITPGELVHSARYQKRLNDAGRVQMNLVDKIASLQARFKNESPVKRLKELQTLVAQATRKVWDDDRDRPVATVKLDNFADTIARLPAAERDYLGGRILADYLSQFKVWKDKVAALVHLLLFCEGQVAYSLVEGFLAEALRSESALDQLLGMPERLEVRCNDLIDLWKGTFEPRDTTAPVAVDINRLIAAGQTPSLRAAIEYSLFRALAGKMPLRSAEPEPEMRAAYDMFKRMWVGQNIIGGAKGIAMLEKRQSRVINTEGVTDLLRERKILVDRLLYLMEMTTLAVGAGNRATLKTFIEHYFSDRDFVPRVAAGQEPPVPKLQTYTSLHKAIRSSWLLEDEKDAYCMLVEQSQAMLIGRSHLFDQIEKKGGSPSQKLLTILDMCRKGTFIDGPNYDAVRMKVQTYLQDPAFIADYVGQCALEERERKVQALLKALGALNIQWQV